MRRVHPVTYPLARKDEDHPLKPFMRRDLSATGELLYSMYRQGYAQGEPLFHQPADEEPAEPPAERFHVDLSFVRIGDLLLQTTRPPMDDAEEGPRKQIERAYTDLEERTFEIWRQYLKYCARTHVRLDRRLDRSLRSGFEDRRQMTFLQNGTFGPYDELNAGKGWHKLAGPRRTPLFLLFLEEAWKGGPGYMCAFGMDGCATQVWCYLLARKLEHLLRKPGFTIAEMEIGELPERVTDLRWCLDWKIELVLEYGLETAGSAL